MYVCMHVCIHTVYMYCTIHVLCECKHTFVQNYCYSLIFPKEQVFLV